MPLLAGEEIAADLTKHLQSCPECRNRVESLRREVHDLRTVPDSAGKGPVQAPEPRPTTIGRYLIFGKLDAGGQAQVYRALHPTLEKELVVKLGHKPLANAPDSRSLLIAEGKLRTLAQHIKEHAVSSREATELVARLARALDVIHRRGVTHQDIKPDNILMDEAGEPRLIDFGLARLRHAWNDPQETPSGGTTAFMAPEQARDERQSSGLSSDIFGLGGVLYFLLTGAPPFPGGTAEEALEQARRCAFDREALNRPGIPKRLRTICLKALAPEPGERYPSAGALAGELTAYLAGRRRLVIAASILAGLLLVGAAWAWLR
jgi:serine/threonine protein kinase